MKKTLFALAFCAVSGLAGAANATQTNTVDLYNQCMTNDIASGLSAECAALQANINAAIQDCLYPPGAQSAGAKSSHGYRAQQLICTASARQQFGTTGH